MRIALIQVFAGLTNVRPLCIIVLDRWSVERTCTAPEGRPRVSAARDFSDHLFLLGANGKEVEVWT